MIVESTKSFFKKYLSVKHKEKEYGKVRGFYTDVLWSQLEVSSFPYKNRENNAVTVNGGD